MCNCGKCSRRSGLCPVSFGVAWGLTMALFMAVLAWVAFAFGHGMNIVEQMSNFYNGYEATVIGGFWGALWGLIEGFLFGFFVALFYSVIVKCCLCCRCCQCSKACKCGPSCNCGPGCKCCAGKA